jgi:hypothetical protein
VTLSALVLAPSPAAPDPAHAICDTGYEPQRLGVRGNKSPAHFTIEEIHRTPSRSNCSLESHKLVKQLVCLHPGSAHAHWPIHAFVGSSHLLRARSDIVQSCYFLRTLFQVVPLAANPFAPFAASVGSLLIALLRPPHPASGIIGHFRPLRSRHVVPQSGNASTPLPNQPQFGTTFIAARGCQASARLLPLLAFLLALPSLPSPCRTTCQSSPCSSSRRQTTRHDALWCLPHRHGQDAGTVAAGPYPPRQDSQGHDEPLCQAALILNGQMTLEHLKQLSVYRKREENAAATSLPTSPAHSRCT